jgi:hypothetical protein
MVRHNEHPGTSFMNLEHLETIARPTNLSIPEVLETINAGRIQPLVTQEGSPWGAGMLAGFAEHEDPANKDPKAMVKVTFVNGFQDLAHPVNDDPAGYWEK